MHRSHPSNRRMRLQVTIKRNNRTNNAQTSHFGWAKVIFRSPECKSESMTNAAPHFPSPFSASGSECKKESRHHPSSSMRRSYVRKDILHPAGVKRSENGLPPSSSVHLECQPDYDEVSSRHQECSAIAWAMGRKDGAHIQLESSGSSTRSNSRSHE